MTTATVTRIHEDRRPITGRLLTGPQFADATGITYRQLDYWTRTGRLRCTKPNPGTGNSQYWPTSEVEVASTARQLIEAGFTLDAALTTARRVVEHGRTWLAGGLVTIDRETT